MNVSKKNIRLHRGWVLCPSKRFPGMFYYFNVLNGEAAWSYSNSKPHKQVLKKASAPQIHEIADKSHEYTEPRSLPNETSITSYDNGAHIKKPNSIRYTQDSPTSGQVVSPKYVAKDQSMNNIVRTPSQLPFSCQESKKSTSDKATQTVFEREPFVQTCNIPQCQRFTNFKKPTTHFDMSTTNYVFEKRETESVPISYKLTPKIAEVKNANAKTTLGLVCMVESNEMAVPKVDEKENGLETFDEIDLRFFLAKRRKLMDALADTLEGRKEVEHSELKPSTTKKVTFNQCPETESKGFSDDDCDPPISPIMETPKSLILQKSSSLSKDADISKVATPTLANVLELPVRKNIWYLVVDTEVLLLDYEFIDNFVLSDPECMLMIPHVVRTDIESISIGDCSGQQRVINARLITRRLATPPPHYTVEPPLIDDDKVITVTIDSILNCCLQAINSNYYVVLITNDPHLIFRATSLNIPSYTQNDIKYGVDIKPDMTSQTENIKINIPNDDIEKIHQVNQSEPTLGLISNLNPSDTVKEQSFIENDNNLDCEAEINVLGLVNNIQSNTEELDLEPDLVQIPLVSRIDTDDKQGRCNFFKSPSYVLNYLEKHYEDWASYKEELDETNLSKNHADIKVIRTVGKNLKLLKIGKKTSMCLQNTIEDDTANLNETGQVIELLESNQINKPDTKNDAPVAEPKLMKLSSEDDKQNDHENVPKREENINDGNNSYPQDTKPIENNTKLVENLDFTNDGNTKIDEPMCSVENIAEDINLENIDSYASSPLSYIFKINNDKALKLKNKEDTSKNLTNKSENKINEASSNTDIEINAQKILENSNCDNVSETCNDKNVSHNDKCVASEFIAGNVETGKENLDQTETIVLDEITTDSGFENDNTNAHLFVKIFFKNLSMTFKVIIQFITSFMEEIREKEPCDLKKITLHSQASECLEIMGAIVQKLKSIIKRESAEMTLLKTLLRNAGAEATNDRRMTRYRNVVMKILEQALILKNALKIVVSTTIGDFDTISTNAESINSSIRYLNVFE